MFVKNFAIKIMSFKVNYVKINVTRVLFFRDQFVIEVVIQAIMLIIPKSVNLAKLKIVKNV